MKDRSLPQAIELNDRPAIQFCQRVAAIINECRPLVKKECFLLSDGLSEARIDYRLLTNAFEVLNKITLEFERNRKDFPMPDDMRAEIDSVSGMVKEFEFKIEAMHEEIDQKQSELEAKESLIKEEITRVNQERNAEIEKKRLLHREHYLNAQSKKRGLEAHKNDIEAALKKKNFFQKMKMRKQKKELKLVRSKIKELEGLIRNIGGILFKDEKHPEVVKLELELSEVQKARQDHIEANYEKIKACEANLRELHEKIIDIQQDYTKSKAAYTATVSKAVMDKMVSANAYLDKFFNTVNALKMDQIKNQRVLQKVTALSRIVRENSEEKGRLFSVLKREAQAMQDVAIVSVVSGQGLFSPAPKNQDVVSTSSPVLSSSTKETELAPPPACATLS
jgi:hypothetical protein